jgi:hypothetical protein
VRSVTLQSDGAGSRSCNDRQHTLRRFILAFLKNLT